MSLKEIQKGISNIKVISHRLELKTSENITIIDDSYNSNPVGSQNAIEVLKLMKGKKVIITPGMVEMGKDEEKLNYEFGRKMANVCDRFYLIGKKRSKPIEKGLLDAGFDSMNIYVVPDLDAATKKLAEITNVGDVVLFENDLPDNYNE